MVERVWTEDWISTTQLRLRELDETSRRKARADLRGAAAELCLRLLILHQEKLVPKRILLVLLDRYAINQYQTQRILF